MTHRLPLIPKVPLTPRELAELAQLAFEWPIRQAPRLMLPLCILAAAVLQALMMVLFSITYHTPSEKTPDAPQMYFLPADTDAARQLAPWLEANDPAAFSPLRATRAASPAMPPLRYRPSYEEPPPALRPLPKETVVPIEPPLLPLSGIRRKASPPSMTVPGKADAVVRTLASSPTRVQWEDGLSSLSELREQAGQSPPLARSASAQPPLYEVAVGPEGIPRHCVLMESSGDPTDDEAARIWIMARRFQPQVSDSSTEAMSWGRVRVIWGNASSQGATVHPFLPRPSSTP